MLGNSEKPVNLETSSFTKFVKWVFRNLEPVKLQNRELVKIWSPGPAKLGVVNLWRSGILNLWSSEIANLRRPEAAGPAKPGVANLWRSGILNLRSPWGREPVKTRSHEPAKPRNRKSAKFENFLKFEFGSHGVWRFLEWGDSQISRKPSQRRRHNKSGFGVWTSGRLVNAWDVKDIHVHVHTMNIPWVREYFRNVKVPSSPYKRGREGTCKSIHNFWDLGSL
jgi:hypothetical protein